jgi:hypothetical protein
MEFRAKFYIILTEKSKNATLYQNLFAQHSIADNVQQLHVQQPSTYAKPEAA